MAIYLHKFDSENAFNAAYNGEDYLEPWVSYTEDQTVGNHVNYNKADPYNGHEYVDLGLPSGTKWAPFNLGASSPEQYGNFYAWGELETKSNYSWETYRFGPDTALTKYNDTDQKTVLDIEDDVVRKEMGGEWKLPSTEQYEELMTYTTQQSQAVVSGVTGTLFTSKVDTGKTLFLPYAGKLQGTDNYDEEYAGIYLTENLYDYNGSVNNYTFTDWPDEGEIGTYLTSARAHGQSARGVCRAVPFPDFSGFVFDAAQVGVGPDNEQSLRGVQIPLSETAYCYIEERTDITGSLGCELPREGMYYYYYPGNSGPGNYAPCTVKIINAKHINPAFDDIIDVTFTYFSGDGDNGYTHRGIYNGTTFYFDQQWCPRGFCLWYVEE